MTEAKFSDIPRLARLQERIKLMRNDLTRRNRIRNGENVNIENLPNELVYKIVNDLDPIDFVELLRSGIDVYDALNPLKYIIYKEFLKKYDVNYKDPTNFIYVANGVSLEDYKINDSWNWRGLMELYMRYFKKTTINCNNLDGMTSFPIYPNMVKFYGNNNKLETFPVQPQMEIFEANDNLLKKFPQQPKMKSFYARNNLLTNFPIQPQMKEFNASNNLLTEFPSQPKMLYFSANNNRLMKFSRQPKMLTFNGRGNNLNSFPTQPRMDFFDGDHIENFNPQPNIHTIIMNDIEIPIEQFLPQDEGYFEQERDI